MKFPDDKIEEIRLANSIVELVQGYVSLKKRGSNYLGLCPFHQEKTPSFNVSPSRGIFKCFGCGKGGNVFGFLMEMERISFGEAVKRLAEKAHIALPVYRDDGVPSESELLYRANGLARDYFYQQLTESSSDSAREAREYLKSRGYGKDIMDTYLLGYAPDGWTGLMEYATRNGVAASTLVQAGLAKEGKDKNKPYDAFRHRIMFPIRNLGGKVIAFGGRRLREPDPAAEIQEAKYINSPETPVYRKGKELFGLWEGRNDIRRQERAILVEGYTDCLSLITGGVKVAVASLGTALTEEQARLLVRFAPAIYIFYDGDSAGLNAARRAMDVLMAAGAQPKVMLLPPEEDPDSFVQKYGAEAVWKLVNEARAPVEFQMELALRTKQSTAEAVKELVATAAKIASPVEQELFLQSVSARTGISGESLNRELARQRSHAPAPQSTSQTIQRVKWPPPGPLTTLARIVIAEPGVREAVFSRWSPERVTDSGLRMILDVLYTEWTAGSMREAETALDHFEEPRLRDFVSECLFEAIPEDDLDSVKKLSLRKKEALDCVGKLEATIVKQEIDQLRAQLAAKPDNEGELLARMAELTRKEKALRAGAI